MSSLQLFNRFGACGLPWVLVSTGAATGLHRPNESSGPWGDERATLLAMGDAAIAAQAGVEEDPLGGGAGVVADIDSGAGVVYANHDAKNAEEHIHIGAAQKGTAFETEAYVDARFINADIRICTGLVEPHFMAGYSGGATRTAKCLSDGSFDGLSACIADAFPAVRAVLSSPTLG